MTFSDKGVMMNATWKDITADNNVYYSGTFPVMNRLN